MRLLVVGATGRTGQQVTKQALERGHSVTALVRGAALQNKDGLRSIVANPLHPNELLPVLEGQDAVISCLGQRSGGKPWLVRDAAKAMRDAMQQSRVKRYLIVSGALLYPTRNPLVYFLKQMMAAKLKDTRAAEEVLASSNLDWTVVRPPHLREGDRKGYRIETGTHVDLTYGLQFADLAACLLEIVEGNNHLQEVVGAASR